MRKNKLIILIIVVGILLITGVTIFTLTRNKVAATESTCTSGHNYITGTSYQDLGDGTHKKTCTDCDYSTTEAHFDYGKDGVAYSGSNGICDKCGCKMVENTCTSGHNYITGTSYQDLGDGTHKKTCTVCGYSTTEAHFDYGKDGIAYSGSNGICDKCGICMEHKAGTEYDSDGEYHWFNCTKCSQPIETTKKACTYGWVEGKSYLSANKRNHGIYCTVCKMYASSQPFLDANGDGKCDIEGCGHNTDIKTETTCNHEWNEYWKSNTHHNAQCKKCEEWMYWEMQSHNFINQKCKECGYVCNHNSGTDLKWTYISINGCAQKCSNCDYIGTTKAHVTTTMFTNNEHWSICENCREVVNPKTNHSMQYSAKDSLAPTCTEKGYYYYECKDCAYCTKDAIPATGHTEIVDKAVAATCTTAGKTEGKHCSTCGIVIVAQTTIPATGHTEVVDKAVAATCTTAGKTEGKHCSVCGTIIVAQQEVPATGHKDKNNDGKCDVCGHIISIIEDQCEHPIIKRKLCNDENEHWFECEKCGEEIEGSREKHKYVNGKCACGVECKHKNTTPKSDDTYHWDECDVCGEKLNKEEHSYKDGECECGKKEDKKDEEECTHTNKEWKANEDEHWQVCKECGKEIEGTRKQHTYENGKCVCGIECKHKNTTPKSDDKYHWDECDVCGEKLNKEEHSYKDGECECGKKEDKKDEEECTHTNKEWKVDSDEHWQVCKDCGKEIEGTRGKHVHVDGKCKNCGLKDNSTAGTVLPNTGREEDIQIAIMITAAILGTALLIKLSREE